MLRVSRGSVQPQRVIPKMSRSPHNAGNVNLRGKKEKLRGCGCCMVMDFREDYESSRVDREEIRPASITALTDDGITLDDFE